MIIDYFANFCDSGYCINENNKCTYPVRKKAELETMWPIQPLKHITKIKIELDCRDKFEMFYPPEAQWDCTIWIDNQLLDHIIVPCNRNTFDLSYTITDPQKLSLFTTKVHEVEVELYANNKIACPYAMDIIVYAEDTNV